MSATDDEWSPLSVARQVLGFQSTPDWSDGNTRAQHTKIRREQPELRELRRLGQRAPHLELIVAVEDNVEDTDPRRRLGQMT